MQGAGSFFGLCSAGAGITLLLRLRLSDLESSVTNRFKFGGCILSCLHRQLHHRFIHIRSGPAAGHDQLCVIITEELHAGYIGTCQQRMTMSEKVETTV